MLTLFDAAVAGGIATLSWYCCGSLIRLSRLRRQVKAEAAFAHKVADGVRKDAGRAPAVHLAMRNGYTRPLLGIYWEEDFVTGTSGMAPLAHVERTRVLPALSQAADLAAMAPQIGLLATVLTLSLGLMGSMGDPDMAAGAVMGRMPTALLSTAIALALAIILRAAVASSSQAFNALEADVTALVEGQIAPYPPARNTPTYLQGAGPDPMERRIRHD